MDDRAGVEPYVFKSFLDYEMRGVTQITHHPSLSILISDVFFIGEDCGFVPQKSRFKMDKRLCWPVIPAASRETNALWTVRCHRRCPIRCRHKFCHMWHTDFQELTLQTIKCQADLWEGVSIFCKCQTRTPHFTPPPYPCHNLQTSRDDSFSGQNKNPCQIPAFETHPRDEWRPLHGTLVPGTARFVIRPQSTYFFVFATFLHCLELFVTYKTPDYNIANNQTQLTLCAQWLLQVASLC